MPIYSIENGMAEALGHLKRVAQHFSDNDQIKIANELGKLSIRIVDLFRQGIDLIPSAEYEMEHDSAWNPIIEPKPVPADKSIHKQAAAALMKQVEECFGIHGPPTAASSSVAATAPALPRVSLQDIQPPQPTWAHGSSGLSAQPQFGGQLMPRLPTAAFPSLGGGQDEGFFSPVMALANGASPSPEIAGEPKAAVIRIHGRVARETVGFITSRIHEGPLQEIRPEGRGCMRVTFQHAAQALALIKSNQDMEQMVGFGRFGSGYHVELVEIVDWNDDHRMMNQPIRERRRLSFARKRLFADNMSPEKWRQDVRNLAGPGNIDFLWVFNSGNATAVFTSTAVARQVLAIFNDWKMGQNEYTDVSVTFSSDPCEKELVLVKAANSGTRGMVRRVIR